MSSLIHEALVELFRASPSLAVDLCRESLGQALSANVTVERAEPEIGEFRLDEYQTDNVLHIVDGEGKLVTAFVVELQLSCDPDKHYSWPVQLSAVYARLQCPVALVVLTLDEAVAEWCRQPIDLGFGWSFMAPVVIGPRAIADLIFVSPRDVAPPTLRNYEFKSEFARKYVAIGRAEGARAMLNGQLRQKFGELPAETRDHIDQANAEELQLWGKRVLDADSLAAVFASDS